MKETKLYLIDPFGSSNKFLPHRHFLRDWSGSYNTADIVFPPLDLMYLSSYLKKNGYQTEIIEASNKHLSPNKVVEILIKAQPNFVLIPSTYFSIEDDKALAKIIKKNVAKAKIIFSGPLVTYDPAVVLDEDIADFVALGELESAVINIVEQRNYDNVAFKKDGEIIRGDRVLIDIDTLPIPDRESIDNDSYRYAVFNKRNPVTAMTISRGCPHSKCLFCPSGLFTLGEIRYRPKQEIFKELEELKDKYNIGEIFFRDQAFTANRDLVVEICNYMLKNGFDILWRATTRVDLVDKELLLLMKKAGCYQISFGFETNLQEVLDANKKGITVEQSKSAAKWAKEAGMEILGLFMTGMDKDNVNNSRNLYEFMLELDVDYVSVNNCLLFPGASLYKEHSEKSKIIPYQEVKSKAGFSPEVRFYMRPSYLFRQLKKIRTISDMRFMLKAGFNILMSGFRK
ncbi:MAG: B12-binding domain-containing radical SAM protein [Candidatus Omnitrophica bacterium]|nr:B12-binding domain-containing radical SAM protein [Candidatus Omnitrophota bacterium]